MFQTFSLQSFLTGIALGILLASIWFVGSPQKLISSASLTPEPKKTETTFAESGALSVLDQRAGDSVLIESVTVPPPGVWVAVREVIAGDLGNVLGAARAGGPKSNLSVPLLRATIPGRTYAIELYRDNGDGNFSLGSDSVYVDFDTGMRVVERFTATH